MQLFLYDEQLYINFVNSISAIQSIGYV